MQRPKGSKNVKNAWEIETPEMTLPVSVSTKTVIKTLDATMPTDNGLTNNQVRAAIRETRAKLNEIINMLNLR